LKSSEGREGIKTFMSDLWEELKILFQESLQISEELREFIMNEAIELVEAIFDLIIEAIKASVDGIIGGLASLVGLGESSSDAAVDSVLREREFNNNYRTKELIMRDTSSSIVKPVGIMANGIPVYSSSQKASSLLTASSAASSAQQSLTITPGTVVINSPTTNNVANGGGGSNPTIVPQNTRNTEIAKYYNPYGGSPMGGF